METPHAERSTTSAVPLELVELELALKHQDCLALGFEGTVRRALRHIEGNLLFHMRLDGVADCDWVAAVALRADDTCVFALVAQPVDGGALRVESAATSDIPVARIVPAYAGLMQSFAAA